MIHSMSTSSEPQVTSTKAGQYLPNTGETASVTSALLGTLAGLTGLGLVAKRRKREDEE